MATGWWALLLGATTAVAAWQWQARVKLRRLEFIDTYRWPKGLLTALQKRHPELAGRDAELVAQGLRQFFRVHLMSGRQPMAMPSRVADDLWHAFILYTRSYDAFCRRAFGRFFHHTPAAVLGGDRRVNTGLRRCWWWCCRDEGIDPRQPSRLPLLFALDAKFHIANGYRYAPDCAGVHRTDGGGVTHCGADFANSGFDGGTDGLGPDDAGGSGGDGDGGDGCGGD